MDSLFFMAKSAEVEVGVVGFDHVLEVSETLGAYHRRIGGLVGG